MRRRRYATFLIALLLGGGFAGLSVAATPEFRGVAVTEHARYYAPRGLKVDVRRSEAFLERLFVLFGVDPGERKIEYYRHPSLEEMRQEVGLRAYGVTNLDTLRIDSVRDYHPHELVHAVAGRIGRPPLLFTEGLAVALTSEGRWQGRDIDEIARAYVRGNRSIDPLLRDFGAVDADRDYALAGSFVAFLLDRDGISPLIAFLRGCGPSPSSYRQAFVHAYGRSVLALGVEWEARLLSGPTPRRAWYDSKDWPRTLEAVASTGTRTAAIPIPSLPASADGARVLSVGP